MTDAVDYDAVVVGGGHNGLVCAAYLQRAGLSTLVLERSDRVGGACVTDELFPGFRISTGAYALSLLLPEIVSELGLDLDVRTKDPHVFAPFEEGRGLFLWDDEAKTHDAIAAVSKRDAAAYPRFVALFEEAARVLRPFLTFAATRKQVRRAFRRSETEGLFDRTVLAPIAAACEEFFESDIMQGVTASQGIIGSAAGPRTPGTAYIYLHHAFGEATGRRGRWGLVRGGMGAVTHALADRVRAEGGEIRTEAEVAAVRVAGKRAATGVVLASGEEIGARFVLSSADPKRTVRLVPPEALLAEFVEEVELLPTDGTVVKVNCALSGLPRFTGMAPNGVGPEHHATITIAPSIDYLEKACRTAAEGRPAEHMFCEAWIQSASEDGLAPPGKHTLSVFAQYAPYELSEGTWESRRDEIGDLVLATLARYAPGIIDLVEERVVLGPPDIEARFGMTGGHIFHGELLPEWLFGRRPASGWHRYRTPLPGLYLCGSGAHPGGGVCGAPGRNAARAVLEDMVAGGA